MDDAQFKKEMILRMLRLEDHMIDILIPLQESVALLKTPDLLDLITKLDEGAKWLAREHYNLLDHAKCISKDIRGATREADLSARDLIRELRNFRYKNQQYENEQAAASLATSEPATPKSPIRRSRKVRQNQPE